MLVMWNAFFYTYKKGNCIYKNGINLSVKKDFAQFYVLENINFVCSSTFFCAFPCFIKI